MQTYIENYLVQFETTLFGPNGADPQNGWRQLANESSAIDYFLFEVGCGFVGWAGGWV